MTDEESSEAILNATTRPDVRTIFVELLGEVKKMNENFTNISYVDEDEPLLSSTAQNKDSTAHAPEHCTFCARKRRTYFTVFHNLGKRFFDNSKEIYEVHLDTRRRANVVGLTNA